ncbi:MAG: sprT domain-containing protein [Bacteroidota bacterium]
MQFSLFQPKHRHSNPGDPAKADQIRSALGSRLPQAAVENVVAQLLENPVSIKVVRARISKSGDFRPAFNNNPPKITINGNLNLFGFLITLVHELAHHHVHLDFNRALKKFTLRRKKRPLPHGEEWKEQFRLLMVPYLNNEVFPRDILPVLIQYLENPKASSSVDHQLSKALKNYDPSDTSVRLEDLPFDAIFTIHGKKIFRKKEKIKTRFRCECMKTSRIYLVSPGAPVAPFMEKT